MTYEERMKLIMEVQYAVEYDPELFKDIVNACNNGVLNAIKQERERAADMEVLAVAFQSATIGKYKKSTDETINNVTHAYCPAKAIAKADTYNTDELISLPHIAVAANTFNFLWDSAIVE